MKRRILQKVDLLLYKVGTGVSLAALLALTPLGLFAQSTSFGDLIQTTPIVSNLNCSLKTDSQVNNSVTDASVTDDSALSSRTTDNDVTDQSESSQTQTSGRSSTQTTPSINPNRASGITIAPFQQCYFTLVPSTQDSDVTLVMDVTSGSNEASGETTFFVLSPDALDTLRTGVRPEFSNVGAGTLATQGTYDDNLVSTVRIVGGTPYTILVVNRTNNTATFDLRAIGGSLQQ